MHDIYPRPSREGDIPLLDEWIRTTPQNLFDPTILQYRKNIRFTCAHNGHPILFMPIQTVYMLDSLAVKPGATDLEVAKSLGVLIQKVVCDAEEMGINEVYFIVKDPTIAVFARRHHWVPMMQDIEQGVSLFRWKVGREESGQ